MPRRSRWFAQGDGCERGWHQAKRESWIWEGSDKRLAEDVAPVLEQRGYQVKTWVPLLRGKLYGPLHILAWNDWHGLAVKCKAANPAAGLGQLLCLRRLTMTAPRAWAEPSWSLKHPDVRMAELPLSLRSILIVPGPADPGLRTAAGDAGVEVWSWLAPGRLSLGSPGSRLKD